MFTLCVSGPVSLNFIAAPELQLLKGWSFSYAELHLCRFETMSFSSHRRELHVLHCPYSHETCPSVPRGICLCFTSNTLVQSLSRCCLVGWGDAVTALETWGKVERFDNCFTNLNLSGSDIRALKQREGPSHCSAVWKSPLLWPLEIWDSRLLKPEMCLPRLKFGIL